jgi:uncharacterized protein YllA (UPF0747 family)
LAKKQIEIENKIQSLLENDRERWIYEKGVYDCRGVW